MNAKHYTTNKRKDYTWLPIAVTIVYLIINAVKAVA